MKLIPRATPSDSAPSPRRARSPIGSVSATTISRLCPPGTALMRERSGQCHELIGREVGAVACWSIHWLLWRRRCHAVPTNLGAAASLKRADIHRVDSRTAQVDRPDEDARVLDREAVLIHDEDRVGTADWPGCDPSSTETPPNSAPMTTPTSAPPFLSTIASISRSGATIANGTPPTKNRAPKNAHCRRRTLSSSRTASAVACLSSPSRYFAASDTGSRMPAESVHYAKASGGQNESSLVPAVCTPVAGSSSIVSVPSRLSQVHTMLGADDCSTRRSSTARRGVRQAMPL